MADINKVIKGLEALYDAMHKNQCYACSHEFIETAHEFGTEIIAEAVELLRMQLKEQEAVMPKQIVRKQCKKEHDDGSIDYFAEWYCPHCNMLILRGFDNPSIKFCYKCGKPILWEGR